MNILGVCNAIDSGAALIVDGKLVAAVNEERFVREKLVACFPRRSIDCVLREGGLSVHDIDWLGCGAWKGICPDRTLPLLVDDVIHQLDSEVDGTRRETLQRIQVSGIRDKKYREELLQGLHKMKFKEESIVFCDHHQAHALTAFCCSPFEKAFTLCADGRGDFRSISIWLGTKGEDLELKSMVTELNSPGALYGIITKYFGFIPHRHEGKVTGLAANGQMSDAYHLMKKGIFFDEQTGTIRSRIGPWYRPFVSASPPELIEELSRFSREDVAFAVQRLLEEILSRYLMYHIGDQPDKSVNLCLAGGIIGNVKLNYELARLPPVRNVYIFPAMGDGGIALGGAIYAAMKYDQMTELSLPTVYVGPAYDNEYIQQILASMSGIKWKRLKPLEKIEYATRLLVCGQVVGWFQGHMEYGPRALGARSILVEATDPKITDTLNERLSRSDFMPFAPVTTNELAPKCFQDWTNTDIASRFMTICYDCTPFLKQKCPAVVHVDGTSRPQVIFREDNLDYFDLVKNYIMKTGNPALINTSFNHHEEPIVNTPEEAIQSYLDGNVDALVLGDYVIGGEEVIFSEGFERVS